MAASKYKEALEEIQRSIQARSDGSPLSSDAALINAILNRVLNDDVQENVTPAIQSDDIVLKPGDDILDEGGATAKKHAAGEVKPAGDPSPGTPRHD